MEARPAGRTRLERDEVHLWWHRIGPDGPAEHERAWLSAEERERAARFRREPDRRAFVARRCCLRAVLAGYLGCAPAELVYAQGEHGKPRLAGEGAELCFSLSRSGEWVLLGVALGRELGVDVERAQGGLAEGRELASLVRRVLTAAECERFERLPRRDRARAFLRAWTRKEAVLKALGTGLAREPASVEVGLEPLGPLEPRRLDPPSFPRDRGALLLDLVAPAGHAASLVAEGQSWNLHLCSRPAA